METNSNPEQSPLPGIDFEKEEPSTLRGLAKTLLEAGNVTELERLLAFATTQFDNLPRGPSSMYSSEWTYWNYAYLIDETTKYLARLKTDPSVAPEHNERSRGEQFSVDLETINTTIEKMLTDPNADPSALREAWAARAILAEEFVKSLEPTPENPHPEVRAKFEVMVDKAFIFEKVGDTLRYLRDLDTAEGFARQWQLDDTADSIVGEIESKVGELDNSPDALVVKLRKHISFQNREYLRDLIGEGITMDDLLDNIYAMILDEGGNPEEVLGSIGLTES